ncbi:MAG TPA: sodium:calcium symporter [Opitutaceae bacterium]|nr:sodium:calcium symporter [Opitutaceae bacterium]
MNPLPDFIATLGLTSVWTYLALFLAASLLMIWRLEALLDHGLEGTALGTLVMPYCSGLGNLLFVAIIAARRGPAQEVLTNCVVNNVTNLTLVLGLPAILWGLNLRPAAAQARKGGKAAGGKKAAGADTAQRLRRHDLQLTLIAALFFGGVTWVLGRDRQIDRNDGLVLMGLFFFWQSFQVVDVLKHNVRERRSFGPLFYFDILVVLAGAYGLYVSIDWIVAWLAARPAGLISAQHLGWVTGGLMVLPNALLAFYYGARGRADIVYASQVGDGHICIPLCLGLSALLQPLPVPPIFDLSFAILCGAALIHLLSITFAGGLPRWMGWPLLAAWAWFAGTGLLG